ncbi:MAG: hypothetical protein R3B09_30320 [Nannocystaceae bacterium]
MVGGWVRTCVGAGIVAVSGCAMPNPAWKELGIGGSGSGSGGELDGTEGSASGSSSESATGSSSESATGSSSASEATTDPGGGGSGGGGSSTTDTGVSVGDPTTEATTEATTTEDPTTDGTESASTTDDTTTEAAQECPCAVSDVHLDDGVFVLADTDVLWKYVPEIADFKKIGKVGCEGVKGPISMAVDRGGAAWILYESPLGALRRIDVADPSKCEAPAYTPGQHGMLRFAMAFASEDIQHPCEELYGASHDGGPLTEFPGAGWLLQFHPDELLLDLVGALAFNGARLTGTGDGRLFLFGGVQSGKLVELDKVSAAPLETLPIDGLPLTGAAAFAFYAGDFYFFTESKGPGSKSKVTRYDYDGDHSLTEIGDVAPIRVVGAGVSTCVPIF